MRLTRRVRLERQAATKRKQVHGAVGGAKGRTRTGQGTLIKAHLNCYGTHIEQALGCHLTRHGIERRVRGIVLGKFK